MVMLVILLLVLMVLAAVSQSWYALKYASDGLKADKAVVLMVLMVNILLYLS